MRDLYNRNKKLDYWTVRIHKDLDEYDKKDVLKFLEIMQEKDQSILTITRCISIVIQIRKQIDKPLSKFTKEDIKTIFQWVDIKKYKVETVEKYRAVIKSFTKWYMVITSIILIALSGLLLKLARINIAKREDWILLNLTIPIYYIII